MAIITHLFNTRITIYRITTPTPSADFGEIGVEQYVLMSRNVQARIGRGDVNEAVREGAVKEPGMGAGQKMKLFLPSGTDIAVGDRIIEQGSYLERYIVDYVNKRPGGLTDHHIECDITNSTFMVVS